MGQKVHPYGLRLGIIRDWQGRWYANKREYADLLHEDLELRKHIKERFYTAGVSRVEIERAANRVKLTIHAARPGMVIGKGGAEVDRLRKDLEQMTGKQIQINIIEIKVPELDAQLVAENIAFQLERRIAFRRAMRQAMQRAMRLGAQGIKVMVAGRLAGAEIARTEWAPEGSIPLQTLRADVDYGFAEAHTTYGRIGVKVWIYKGEILPERQPAAAATQGGE
ncbi:MAG: 30S ribosomal protein S3 [Limnochordales bacterium]|nr:MAG: 30S ribosomal protein S3 [Bacillota bacterium]